MAPDRDLVWGSRRLFRFDVTLSVSVCVFELSFVRRQGACRVFNVFWHTLSDVMRPFGPILMFGAASTTRALRGDRQAARPERYLLQLMIPRRMLRLGF